MDIDIHAPVQVVAVQVHVVVHGTFVCGGQFLSSWCSVVGLFNRPEQRRRAKDKERAARRERGRHKADGNDKKEWIKQQQANERCEETAKGCEMAHWWATVRWPNGWVQIAVLKKVQNKDKGSKRCTGL